MMAFLRAFGPQLLIGVAILGAMWWLDHRGYERATRDADARQAKIERKIEETRRALETELGDKMTAGDRLLADQIGAIEVHATTKIMPTIEKELARDPRFSDPAAALSDSMFRAINEARRRSACTARPDGGIECTVPEPASDP